MAQCTCRKLYPREPCESTCPAVQERKLREREVAAKENQSQLLELMLSQLQDQTQLLRDILAEQMRRRS